MCGSKTSYFFVVSLVLHILICGCLVLSVDWTPLQKKDDLTTIEIESVDTIVKKSNRSKDLKLVQSAAQLMSAGRKDKLVRGFFAGNKIEQLIQSDRSRERSLGENDSMTKSELKDSFLEPSLYDFQSDQMFSQHSEWEYYRAVYEKVDSHIVFDTRLAQYNHFGTVYVQFRLSPSGELLQQDLKAKSDDGILKVHVMRALRKSLVAGALAENQVNPSGRSVLFRAKFDFLQDSPSLNFKKQKEFGRSVLVFRRATLEKPISNTLKDHLMNGGIDYNLFAATERWEKYNHKKMLRETGFDPFLSYKEDQDYNL